MYYKFLDSPEITANRFGSLMQLFAEALASPSFSRIVPSLYTRVCQRASRNRDEKRFRRLIKLARAYNFVHIDKRIINHTRRNEITVVISALPCNMYHKSATRLRERGSRNAGRCAENASQDPA